MSDYLKGVSAATRRLLLLGSAFILAAMFTVAAVAIPQIRVQSVVDHMVTGTGWDFPAGATFNIRLAPYGGRGAGGVIVGQTTANADGTVAYSATIPEELRGHSRIAIRLDGYLNYFSYAWFHNSAAAAETTDQGTSQPTQEQAQPAAPSYRGFPTFSIREVDAATHSVTIEGRNFPPNQMFTFRINSMGTRGVEGLVVGSLDSGSGGQVLESFTIPEALRGHSRLAIRADSPAGYYAYNWFSLGDAQTAAPATESETESATTQEEAGTGGEPAADTPTAAAPGYTGYPTFWVSSVVAGSSVTVITRNLPPNATFSVIMGDFGSRGLSGFKSVEFNSGEGGAQTLTFPIPAQMADAGRIAIRLQGVDNPYFAYAWFWN